MKRAKGDHRHIGSAGTRYKFVDPETLLADFWNDVEAWRSTSINAPADVYFGRAQTIFAERERIKRV
jgi:hypothetical protein